MIAESYEKVKGWCKTNKGDLFTAGIIFCVGLGSFGLGRLSAIWPEKEPITVTNQEAGIMNYGSNSDIDSKERLPDSKPQNPAWQGRFVASKSGKYYYLPSCSGAARIKDANKIWFETEEEAKSRGLASAANCPGL